MQRGEGLFGPLIVRRNNAKNPHWKLYDYDLSEHVIMINDWTHRVFIQAFVDLVHDHGGLQPDNILINGRGVQSGQAGPQTPRSVFTVKQGKKYRFRMIYSGHLICPIQVSIAGHKVLVIASDGRDLSPVSADFINLASGNN
jgi:L-ascorbate oxidase